MNMPIQVEDYPVIITRDGDIHVLRIGELFLVERDANLAVGLERLQQRARDLIAEQTALGALDGLPRPGGVARDDEQNRRVKVFALKSALVALVLVIVMAAAAASFSYAVRESMHKVGLKMGRAAIAQVERGLRKVARQELTPERRERFRISVAEAVPNLKPYVAELRPLLAELCPPGQ